ncbi:CoA transferase [Nocardia speluncae]|uniref:CoA transferase n=1 Tax=Nocardia speluncae TaxID=419477 RepID=A0A846X8S1_9NOCA|nr:CoA transferase [Nocardia speluncae]NKY31867.1 CoA transferase [Nocardia speluncae]
MSYPTSQDDPSPRGPLSNVRVIEMGQLLAGPFCGQLLADFDADVIKLEDPGRGDPMRQWGRNTSHGESLWWPVVGRNKRSVTCNLRTAQGQQIARDLIATADILVENFRPGTLERWGLGYEELRALNPKLVMVRVTGYGQTGPYAPRAGYGSIGEAMGGLRYITGDPESLPSRTGISIGDSLAAIFATIGALVALHSAQRTGSGQIVDSAIYEAVLALMESTVPEYELTGYQRERSGSILPNVAPSNVYPTADSSSILIAANQDTVFRRLAIAMGRPELADDPRYGSHTARGANQGELDDLVSRWTSQQIADDLLKLLEDSGVPAGRIYRAQDMLADPHFTAREAIVTVQHKLLGDFPVQNVAPKLSGTPGSIRWLGPELGEHTDEVLRDVLARSRSDIDAMRTSGAI